MVSLANRQALAQIAAEDVHLKKLQLLLNGETSSISVANGSDVREILLEAIGTNDQDSFKAAAVKIGERRISPESDWCHDDYLIFLLLLGNEKFGRPLKFLSAVIEVRRKTVNAIPRKINEIFAALERQEFGLEGEFGFLKIPFLSLTNKLKLSVTDAIKVLQVMSEVLHFDKLTPFIQLLTLKAYDLVLTERQPLPVESAEQVIEGFESQAKNLTLKQWGAVLLSLPGRIIWTIVGAIVGIGLLPILFGVGQKLVEEHSEQPLNRPQKMEVSSVLVPDNTFPPEIQKFEGAVFNQSISVAIRAKFVAVQCKPFTESTPYFVIEVSHPDKPIEAVLAFVQTETMGIRPFTVLPVEHESGRFRILMSEQKKGEQLCLLVAYTVMPNDDIVALGHQTVLRCLQ